MRAAITQRSMLIFVIGFFHETRCVIRNSELVSKNAQKIKVDRVLRRAMLKNCRETKREEAPAVSGDG